MKRKSVLWLGLIASLAVTPIARAQVPVAPAAAGAAAPAPAAPGNLWSFLLPNADQKNACKTCFCNSPVGQMVTGAVGPMSAMSGGLIQNRCLQNSIANDIANKAADDPEGAAARIMKDEEDAKARRAAVRFLGTVDCNYWPEAKAALINALRADRNECVRFEAALSLQKGCCCNNEVVAALKICVTGSKEDGHPAESSDRVRAAAVDALAHCLLPIPEPTEKEKELQKTEIRPRTEPGEYYRKIADMPREKVVEGARAVLVSVQKGTSVKGDGAAGKAAIPPVAPIAPRPSTALGILGNAFNPGAATGSNANQPRSPFFAGLTKTLTGKQDGVSTGRSDVMVPGKETIVPVTPGTALPAPRETTVPALPQVLSPMPGETIVPVRPETPAPARPVVPLPVRRENAPPIVRPEALPPISSTIDPALPVRRDNAPIIRQEALPPVSSTTPSSEPPHEFRGFVTVGD